MGVPALTRAASEVVRVRVASSRCAWTEDHRRLVTLVEMDVLERWKGETGKRLTVLQLGGEKDGIGQRVEGVLSLATGEELVLFLERQGGLYRVVGLSEGIYRVERPSGAGLPRAVPASVPGLVLLSAAPEVAAQQRVALPLETLRRAVLAEAIRQ
jgi:hypothetical protein